VCERGRNEDENISTFEIIIIKTKGGEWRNFHLLSFVFYSFNYPGTFAMFFLSQFHSQKTVAWSSAVEKLHFTPYQINWCLFLSGKLISYWSLVGIIFGSSDRMKLINWNCTGNLSIWWSALSNQSA
jgi:hypothetical protein